MVYKAQVLSLGGCLYDLNRGRLRSIEVDRGRDSVWAISRRPEVCRSSESHQHVDVFMLRPVVWIGGPSSGKIMDLLVEEGSNVEDFFQKTSV